MPSSENQYAQYHVVEDHDTLASIAEYYYGSTAYCGKLLDANRQVLDDERSIRPGLRLIIP